MTREWVFPEAARLYAENALVVKEIRAAFEAAVDEFRGKLRDAVEPFVEPFSIEEKVTPKIAYWWLKEGDDSEPGVVQLWWTRHAPEIVHPGFLEVNVGNNEVSDEIAAALRQVPERAGLSDVVRVGNEGLWSLLIAEFQYDPDSPVSIARPVAELLRATHQAVHGKS